MTDNWISVQTTTETHSQKNETRKKNKKNKKKYTVKKSKTVPAATYAIGMI